MKEVDDAGRENPLLKDPPTGTQRAVKDIDLKHVVTSGIEKGLVGIRPAGCTVMSQEGVIVTRCCKICL